MRSSILAMGVMLMFTAYAGTDAGAQDSTRSVRLLLDAGVMQAVQPSLQHSATETTAGVVHMSERLRALSVTTPADGPGAAWSATHTIVVVTLAVAVEPVGARPRLVAVGAQFRSIGEAAEQPVILDAFPATAFVPANASGEVALAVTPELKLSHPMVGSLGIGGKAAMALSWKPGNAKIVSGHSDATAFWQFEAQQDWWPVGQLPLTLLLAVPKGVTTSRLALDVRAELSGGLFAVGAVGRATQVATLALP